MNKDILTRIKESKNRINYNNGGRNEVRIIIQDFLGQEINDKDIDLAILDDSIDNEFIAEKFADIISKFGESFSASQASEIFLELGELWCDKRCFNNIFYDLLIESYLKTLHSQIENTAQEHLSKQELESLIIVNKKLRDTIKAKKYLARFDLENSLDIIDPNGELSLAFFIYCHLYKNVINYDFDISHLFSITFTNLEAMENYKNDLQETLRKIWQKNKLTNEDYQRINIDIQNAVETRRLKNDLS